MFYTRSSHSRCHVIIWPMHGHLMTCDDVRPHETLRHWWHRREWGRHIIVTRTGATRQSSLLLWCWPSLWPRGLTLTSGIRWYWPDTSVATQPRPGCQGRIRVTPKHWWLALGEQRIMILKLLNLLTTASNTIIHGQLWLPSAASNLETHTTTNKKPNAEVTWSWIEASISEYYETKVHAGFSRVSVDISTSMNWNTLCTDEAWLWWLGIRPGSVVWAPRHECVGRAQVIRSRQVIR